MQLISLTILNTDYPQAYLQTTLMMHSLPLEIFRQGYHQRSNNRRRAHMPFGGVKATGNGHREGGWTVYDFYTEWKAVYIDYSGKLQRAQIDNY